MKLLPRLPLGWITAAALALALASHSALALGGKSPGESVENDEKSAAAAAPDCGSRICIGHTVLIKKRDLTGFEKVTVAGTTGYGAFTVRHEDGHSSDNFGVYLYSIKPSCQHDRCIGDVVINTINKEFQKSKIIGIGGPNGDGKMEFAIEGVEGSIYASTATNRHLAITKPGFCIGSVVCVGDQVNDRKIARPSEDGTVIGIVENGERTFIDQFLIVEYSNGKRRIGTILDLHVTIRKSEVSEMEHLEKEGVIDRSIYDEMRSRGKDHAEALEAARGPVWISEAETRRFVDRLALSVYAFDREYFQQVGRLLAKPGEQSQNAFVSMALLPFLKNFGYAQLKARYLDGSVQRIEAAMQKKGLASLRDVEPSPSTRRLALEMLGISLTTAHPQMSDTQKAAAAPLIRALSECAASPLRMRDMETLLRSAPSLERFLLDLSQNPYLQGRVATDMALLEFLRNS